MFILGSIELGIGVIGLISSIAYMLPAIQQLFQ